MLGMTEESFKNSSYASSLLKEPGIFPPPTLTSLKRVQTDGKQSIILRSQAFKILEPTKTRRKTETFCFVNRCSEAIFHGATLFSNSITAQVDHLASITQVGRVMI